MSVIQSRYKSVQGDYESLNDPDKIAEIDLENFKKNYDHVLTYK